MTQNNRVGIYKAPKGTISKRELLFIYSDGCLLTSVWEYKLNKYRQHEFFHIQIVALDECGETTINERIDNTSKCLSAVEPELWEGKPKLIIDRKIDPPEITSLEPEQITYLGVIPAYTNLVEKYLRDYLFILGREARIDTPEEQQCMRILACKLDISKPGLYTNGFILGGVS